MASNGYLVGYIESTQPHASFGPVVIDTVATDKV
jgi:hypothetical protein